MIKIAFITAIFGRYEATTKHFVQQQTKDPTEVDFICFADSPETLNNAAGWIVDSTPYHMTHRSPMYHSDKYNSLENNQHTFNVAKYYKQSFHNIPRLAKYDIVVWLDGTVQITSPFTAQSIVDLFRKHPERRIITWQHDGRPTGSMEEEVRASYFDKYYSTHWFGQVQPLQDVGKQYEAYLADGYKDIGVWCTCFVAFHMQDREWSSVFLDLWYDQTLRHTTQDQVGFPYCVFKLNHVPYTLPDENISGVSSTQTDFYVKRNHHQ